MSKITPAIALLLILDLSACGGSGGAAGSNGPAPPVVIEPTYQATFVLAQPDGAPAVNATLYANEMNCTGVLCKAQLTTDANGSAYLIVEQNQTYCLSTTGYINESGALNPPQYVVLTAGGALYEQLPACVDATVATFYLAE